MPDRQPRRQLVRRAAADLGRRQHPQLLADLDVAAADLAGLVDGPERADRESIDDLHRRVAEDSDTLVEADIAPFDPNRAADPAARAQLEPAGPDPHARRCPEVVVAGDPDLRPWPDDDLVGLDQDVRTELDVVGDLDPRRRDPGLAGRPGQGHGTTIRITSNASANGRFIWTPRTIARPRRKSRCMYVRNCCEA